MSTPTLWGRGDCVARHLATGSREARCNDGAEAPVTRRLAVVATVLALAPSASAALPDPCTLLTNAEVATAFGSKVQSRAGENHRFGRSCAWEGVPLGSFTSAHASLRVDIAHVSRAQCLKHAKKAKNAVPVHGIGDLAYSQYVAGQSLTVWRHGIWLSLDLTGVSSPLASAKALARSAI